MLKDILPTQTARTYASVDICIYCGATEGLSDEHIIPLGLGGRLVLPRASCGKCAALTSAFEGTVLRTMFGPLRMFYDMPRRRKSKRPATLPLKVKQRAGDDWTHLEVEREQYPFLVLIPYLSTPTFPAGRRSDTGPGASRFWIRGASIGEGFKPHLQDLCDKLSVRAVMPTAEARVPEFCLMLAKIAHAYAVAECGRDAAEWILPAAILARDVSRHGDGLDHASDAGIAAASRTRPGRGSRAMSVGSRAIAGCDGYAHIPRPGWSPHS